MSFDIDVAARTVYGEARGEGPEGILAVAWVIYNRFHAGNKWFSAKTLAGTCMKREQFSCWNPTDPNYSIICNLPENDQTLISCRNAVNEVLTGIDPDPTQGATHYCNLDIARPSWTARAKRTVKIGKHTFFIGVD